MHPIIWRVPFIHWDLPGYGLLLMLGFLLSVIWAARRAARSGANPDVVLNCAFIALLGGVIGARFMHVVDYWHEFSFYGNWLQTAIAIIDLRKGGLEVYGGVITAMVGAVVYLAGWRHSVRWYLDILAPSLALGMGLGRVGCFLNGCCWGKVCELPWAVRFPYGSNAMTQQWYDGQPGMELPKELIYCSPNGINADGRAAFALPREVLWVTQQEIDQSRAAAAAAQKEIQDVRSKLDQTQDARERTQLAQRLEALQLKKAGTVLQYADIRSALDNYGLTLPQLQQLARQYHSQPVHPTQLYSTIMLVLLALLLSAVYWRRTRDGQVMCTFLLIEPWSRYVLELLRADNPQDVFGFTISQKLAIGLSLAGLLGFFALRWLPPRSPRATLWVPPPEEIVGGSRKGRPAQTRA